MPATSSVAELREAVMELSCLYFEDRKAGRRPLAERFVVKARQHWRRPAVSDSAGRRLSYGETLTGAVALARALEPRLGGQERVGLLLPCSVGGALANLAVSLSGRVPVNLNFTASDEVFRSALDQCGIRTLITSRQFLERLGRFKDLPGAVNLEDIAAGLAPLDKAAAWLRAQFVPARWLARSAGFRPDDVATILFSSGSTGTPKGVMLSHHNILSNVESMRSVFHFTPDDNVAAALPFFHSFGFTCSLWLPLLTGISVGYHPNPMDGGKIAELVRTNRSTLLFATPTFLSVYLRKAKTEDFLTLRYVVVGAEKLKPALADAFQEQFNVRPLEGYGATELAPVAALSLPDAEIWGVRQTGAKPGSVGHPLPGVAVRVVDPETGARLPPGQAGLLFIRGPNVMLGYWQNPVKTAEVLKDGWYNTGDIVTIDRDGFITITDRLSRFSKLGGEMVPHGAIEDAFHQALGAPGPVLAVTAVPDERKGERLVVLCTDEAGPVERLQQIMKDSALPNLWKPAPDGYYRRGSLPILGSGKLDLKALKAAAVRLVGDMRTKIRPR
jgi:acyl-[acyl-carrier-protein]-phospholipid O-acyltransferase/long-chain-fatty-acid--[acyl-carrier-protein] ligase